MGPPSALRFYLPPTGNHLQLNDLFIRTSIRPCCSANGEMHRGIDVLRLHSRPISTIRCCYGALVFRPLYQRLRRESQSGP